MQSNKEFGERLKTLRKEHGKTQLDVAQRLGITPQAVSKWESGGSLPDCFNLQSLSELYGISLDTLLQIRSSGTEKDLAQKTGVLVQEYIHDHPDTPLFSLFPHSGNTFSRQRSDRNRQIPYRPYSLKEYCFRCIRESPVCCRIHQIPEMSDRGNGSCCRP